MTNILLIAVIAVITIFVLLNILKHDSFALSPSFPLQVIINNHNQWSVLQVPQKYTVFPSPTGFVKLAKNPAECKVEQSYPRPSGISAVSYISNGKTLNATMWLSHPLVQPPSNASAWWRPPFAKIPWFYIAYFMSLHVISVYDTGGTDYAIGIEWNIRNNTWTKTTYLISPLGDKKVLNQIYNYSVPLGNKYIDLSIDLGPLNYPNLYDILFRADDFYVNDGHLCRMTDVANRVYVPPPEFSITAVPNTVTLRPGEEANIELQVISHINIQSQVSLSVIKSNDVQTSIAPILYLPPNGISTPILTIKTLEDAKPHPHTLPIVANFSIPTEVKSTTTTQANTPTIQTARGSNTALTEQVSNLTLIVKPAYTISEQLKNFVSSWIQPLNALWGFLAGVAVIIGPLIIRRKQKNRVKTNTD